jgi:hypothetical protein
VRSAQTGTYALGPAAGRVVIRTARAGLAARAGHDLVLEVTRWSARVEVPAEESGEVAVTAELDLGSLRVKEGTGGARPLTDADRADILTAAGRILGPGKAAFTSTRVALPGVTGTVDYRGHRLGVRLQVAEPVPGRYRGSATVPQTAFGVTPYSGFFGALRLRDEVSVEFDVDLSRADHSPG